MDDTLGKSLSCGFTVALKENIAMSTCDEDEEKCMFCCVPLSCILLINHFPVPKLNPGFLKVSPGILLWLHYTQLGSRTYTER